MCAGVLVGPSKGVIDGIDRRIGDGSAIREHRTLETTSTDRGDGAVAWLDAAVDDKSGATQANRRCTGEAGRRSMSVTAAV